MKRSSMKRTHSVIKFMFLYLLTHSRFQGISCMNQFVRFRKFEALDGQTCPEEHADIEKNIQSRTKCLFLCAGKTSCRGAFFEPDTQKCIKCSTDTATISAPTTSTFYKLQADETSDGPYRFVDDKLSWEDAKQNCLEIGGYLTSVKSSEEQTDLENFVTVHSNFGVWIGGKGVAGDAPSFQWLDDTYVVSGYENWYGNEPRNVTGRECIKLGEEGNLQWKAKDCADTYYSVCKLE